MSGPINGPTAGSMCGQTSDPTTNQMANQGVSIARELRFGGILQMLGLAVTVVSLIWKAPLSFLMFAGIGSLLIFAGIVVYLISLVSAGAISE
jgi:hypothetical protein